jgi:hypothetical protein
MSAQSRANRLETVSAITRGASRSAIVKERLSRAGGGRREDGMRKKQIGSGALLVVVLGVACAPGPKDGGGKAAPPAGSAAEPGRYPAGKPSASERTAEPRAEDREPPAVVVPEGTTLTVALESTVSSARNQAGDTFLGKLSEPIEAGGRVLVPAGAEVRGKVLVAQGSGRVKGVARLAVAFDRLEVDGRKLEIETSSVDVTAQKQHGRDAKIAGGAAAAGALIGAIADGGSGAAKGALIGGAAGGGAVLATKGKEVEFSAGNRLKVKLKKPVRL